MTACFKRYYFSDMTLTPLQSNRECVVAKRLEDSPDAAGLPGPDSWAKASPVSFSSDWCGNHSDPGRETEVRLLWSPLILFIRFRCRFRDIHTFEPSGGRRNELWLRDVAEIFIQPDAHSPGHYREFEIAPNGDWLDLDIKDKQKSCLLCDLKTRVDCSSETGAWIAEMAIPMHCLTAEFHPDQAWRLNLFRIEGQEPNRFYSAWRPTWTPEPNFHVPAHFGNLYFATA